MDGRFRRLLAVVAVLATVATLGVAAWFNLPCANGHPAPNVLETRGCYSDVLALYGGRHLDEGALPYVDADVEYPVLIGAAMAAVGLPVHALGEAGRLDPVARALGFETVDEGVFFFWGTAALSSLLALICTLMLVSMRRRRPADVLLWAFAPVLAVESFINWDLVAAPFAVGVLWAWSKGRPGWAGVFAGLGAAAKIYPGLLVLPLLLLCLRARRDGLRPAIKLIGGAAGAWGLINLPVAIVSPGGWWHPYDFSAKRWIDWGTLWFLADHLPHDGVVHRTLHGAWSDVPSLNLSSMLLFGVGLAGLAVLTFLAPTPPRVAQVAFLVVALFLLTNKVWSPQFALWLAPLAALALPRLLPLLAWQLVELVYFHDVIRAIVIHLDDYAFVQFALARWTAVALLAATVVGQILRPSRDRVRTPDGLDPDDGVLQPVRSLFGGGDPDDVPSDVEQGSQGWLFRPNQAVPSTLGRPSGPPGLPVDVP